MPGPNIYYCIDCDTGAPVAPEYGQLDLDYVCEDDHPNSNCFHYAKRKDGTEREDPGKDVRLKRKLKLGDLLDNPPQPFRYEYISEAVPVTFTVGKKTFYAQLMIVHLKKTGAQPIVVYLGQEIVKPTGGAGVFNAGDGRVVGKKKYKVLLEHGNRTYVVLTKTPVQ